MEPAILFYRNRVHWIRIQSQIFDDQKIDKFYSWHFPIQKLNYIYT